MLGLLQHYIIRQIEMHTTEQLPGDGRPTPGLAYCNVKDSPVKSKKEEYLAVAIFSMFAGGPLAGLAGPFLFRKCKRDWFQFLKILVLVAPLSWAAYLAAGVAYTNLVSNKSTAQITNRVSAYDYRFNAGTPSVEPVEKPTPIWE